MNKIELKLISAGTTVRNPDRLINFFKSLISVIEGKTYSKQVQHDIQIVLIQTRNYGYGNNQFYKNLKKEYVELLENNKPLSFSEAKEIYLNKMENYKIKDGIRGRTSISSLNKFGFFYTVAGHKIIASEIGKKYLNKEISETLFFQKVLLKWQFGNNIDEEYKKDDGYNIKPFVAFLHLLLELNKKIQKIGKKPIGISALEFDLFIPSLINYKDINNTLENIINFRNTFTNLKTIKEKNKLILDRQENIIKIFNVHKEDKKKKFINNLSEYGQNNLLLYYLKTDLIELRGADNYIDIKRDIDGKYISAVSEICEKISPEVNDFSSPIEEFENFSHDIKPELSFFNAQIKENNAKKTAYYLNEQGIQDLKTLEEFNGNVDVYNDYLDQKVNKNKIEKFETRNWTEKDILDSINGFSNIKSYKGIKWIEYERLSYWSILQLNDHKMIKPNFPINEDGYPKKKGAPGIPDIECVYEDFSIILEVTLKVDKKQWLDETTSVMEHLEDFIEKSDTKYNYCLFIAPSINDRAAKTFFQANKNGFGGDKKLGIVPLNHNQFCKILKIQSELIKNNKKILSSRMLKFYEDVHLVTNSLNNYTDWFNKIDSSLNSLISEY